MNVITGGTLYQDLPSQFGTSVIHRSSGDDFWVYHDVTVSPDTHLSGAIGSEIVNVAS